MIHEVFSFDTFLGTGICTLMSHRCVTPLYLYNVDEQFDAIVLSIPKYNLLALKRQQAIEDFGCY